MRSCERCESPIDKDRPGYVTRSGRAVHNQCPQFVGEMVDIGWAEVFEVDGIPRIVYVTETVNPRGAEGDDVRQALEEHYERRVSLGSWRQEQAAWLVPTPTMYNGLVWVCRTDGWAPDLEE